LTAFVSATATGVASRRVELSGVNVRAMSSDERESRRRESERLGRESERLGRELKTRRRNTIAYVVMALFVATWPWFALVGRAPSFRTIMIAPLICVGIVSVVGWVWVFLRFRAAPAWVVALLVIADAVLLEGIFADVYYAMSATLPHAFDPPTMTGIDAAYFTISTATTTGMGDIHPVSGTARVFVSAQMVTSVYLVAIAITTAVQRVLAPAADENQQRHRRDDEPPQKPAESPPDNTP
jgi:Ion channel